MSGTQSPASGGARLPIDQLTDQFSARLHIRLNRETHKQLVALDEDRGTTISDEMRIAIARHLNCVESDELPYIIREQCRGTRTSIRLDERQNDRLEELAQQGTSSRSDRGRTAVVEHLERTDRPRENS